MTNHPHSPLIGFHGLAGSGKDTCTKRLVQRHGFERMAFADPVKQNLEILNPYLSDGTRLMQALNMLGGWDRVKEHRIYKSEVRRLMQVYATEVTRGTFGDMVWVDLASKLIKPGPIAFSDVREDHEARWIKDRGGVIVHVVVPDLEPVNEHVSEAGISPELVDFTLVNSGTITELWSYVDAMVVAPVYA